MDSSNRGTVGKLSEREEEIIYLIAGGMRDKDIGEQLAISSETVRTHVKSILLKLKSPTRPMAVAKFTLRYASEISCMLRSKQGCDADIA
jgi:DNA-binding CsgD family transcriptional regulator